MRWWRSTPGRRVLVAAAGLSLTGVLIFGALAPPERCPDVTADGLRDASGEIVDWFARNQNPDGSWLYLYRAPTDTIPDDYNAVRHAGGVMGLYMAAGYDIDGAFEGAERGLDWSIARLAERDDWSAAGASADEPSVGATALLLAGLTLRRDQTGDDAYDELMRRLGRFLTGQTEPSGAVRSSYDLAAGEPIAGVYSKYYTGEAYWAIAAMDRVFPDEGWGEVADRIGAYVATRRDDVEDYWPRLPDHWAAYGVSETVASGDPAHDRMATDDEAAYARQQAGLFGAQVRWVAQQAGPWGSVARGPSVPRGGGYGVVGEALTGWWRVADADPRLADVRDAIGVRAMCIAGLAVEMQSDAGEAAAFAVPERVQGAWFRDGETRMDDQQHALSALLRTIVITEAEETDANGAAPSAWLWLLALVAAFNPARVALGVPERRARSSERATIAGLGSLVGAGLVVLAAVASDALLDAFDVTAPAFRIAAGIVGAVAGIVAVVRRGVPIGAALPGRRAALVPVAVPFVANVALVVLAISAAADRGLATVVVAVAAGTVLTVAAALAPPDGTTGRLLAVAIRATAAVLVLTGVLLTIDGVLAV